MFHPIVYLIHLKFIKFTRRDHIQDKNTDIFIENGLRLYFRFHVLVPSDFTFKKQIFLFISQKLKYVRLTLLNSVKLCFNYSL